MATFSEREGIAAEETPISVRYEAPAEFRALVPILLERQGLSSRMLNEYVCRFLIVPEDGNWSRDNLRDETRYNLKKASWYKLYEFVEKVYDDLSEHRLLPEYWVDEFEVDVNRFFVERGFGWVMSKGVIRARLEAPEQTVVEATLVALEADDHTTAAKELREAIRDLSRRPDPDLTGAIQHACASLECLARTISGKPSKTLGQLKGVFPTPLDGAVDKLWGFSSQIGRHVEEGRDPELADAIAVVGFAATLSSYLLERLRGQQIR